MTTAAVAVSLIAHCGIPSGDTSARVMCQKSLFRYSPKMSAITALPTSAMLSVSPRSYLIAYQVLTL